MAAITDVTLTSGLGTAGTGTVSTLDKFNGTAGSPATQALTVQGIASGTPQPVSLASVPSHAVTNAGTFATQESGALLTSSQLIDDTITAQGTALGSTKTNLVGASVTTAAPTYTTGQINPLSLDTAGNLRVNVVTGGGSGGTSSTVGSAAPSTATAVGFSDGTNMQLGVIKAASTAPVATDRAIVVAISPNSVNANGRTTPVNSAPVVLNSMTYQTVAASTTQQCGSTGASGDYLDGVLIVPGTAAAGVVQIKDGSGSAINIFAGGGTTALPTLAPFFVPVGAISSGGSGGWKVITNANVTAIAVGNFT